MPRRTRRSRRSRRGLTIGLLVVASIAIITLDYRGQAHGIISSAKRAAHDTFSPIQRGVDALVRPVGSFLSGAVHAGDLEAQNAKLQREIDANVLSDFEVDVLALQGHEALKLDVDLVMSWKQIRSVVFSRRIGVDGPGSASINVLDHHSGIGD